MLYQSAPLTCYALCIRYFNEQRGEKGADYFYRVFCFRDAAGFFSAYLSSLSYNGTSRLSANTVKLRYSKIWHNGILDIADQSPRFLLNPIQTTENFATIAQRNNFFHLTKSLNLFLLLVQLFQKLVWPTAQELPWEGRRICDSVILSLCIDRKPSNMTHCLIQVPQGIEIGDSYYLYMVFRRLCPYVNLLGAACILFKYAAALC